MFNAEYNPFGKRLAELEATDLEKLRQVSEGWYIEYKSALPTPNKVAKAVAAFANTYGGWLFIGIEEAQNRQRTAGGFPGLDATKIAGEDERLRNSIAANIFPTPYFETKHIYGSTDATLPPSRAVIVIFVPRSSETPHIHSDGRIYRRVGDQSDPKHEVDPYQVQKLSARKADLESKVEERLALAPPLPQGERGLSLVDVIIRPRPGEKDSPIMS